MYRNYIKYLSSVPRCSNLVSPEHEISKRMLHTYYLACSDGSTSSHVDHGGEGGRESDRGITCVVGGTGMGKRPEAGDPQRGRGDQVGKSGGGTDGRRDDTEGVPGKGKILERTTPGGLRANWNEKAHRQGHNACAQEVRFFGQGIDKALGVRGRYKLLH